MKHLYLSLLFIAFTFYSNAQSTNLENEFVTPPSGVQTSVYWYWMSGNISKEGVIKDLEAMKKVGINRAFIGNIYFDPYEGGHNVNLMSDEWWDVTHTALKKAGELGIEIGMFNSPGWSQAGGPWVKPNQTMRYLASSELKVKGPAKINTQLKKPNKEFEDVKVLAYRMPKDEGLLLTSSNAGISVNPALQNSEKLFDGNTSEGALLPENVEVTININAAKAFTARSLTIYPVHSNIDAAFELQAKEGNEYKTISTFTIDWHHLSLIVGFQPYAPVVLSLNETTAKEFRLLVKNKRNEGGIAEIELSSASRIENYAAKTFAKMFQDPLPAWDHYMWRTEPEYKDPSLNINPDEVLDISKYLSADGTLTWNVPKGEWIILRTGMTPTGVTNNPAGPDGTGLETDKMSKEHVASHFDAFIGKILKRIPAEDRKTFKVVVQDSYESGGQNFTDTMLTSFKERYGYDAVPFLPAYFGKVVGNKDQSDRFLWDMRRLIADKVAYDYVGGFREVCHNNGLTTWLENYGHWGFPSEFLMYGGQSDEVGGEYWLPSASGSWENNLGNIENRAASSASHIYGKNLVSSESNTSGGPAFSRVPADAKQRTDKYFSEGVNNTLFHVFIHQPDTDKFPGTNAWFGTEFNRNNTWFTHMDLFVNYIKRCNYMLRQGLNIADVAYFIGEDTPKMTGIQDPALPVGYQFDYINAEVLLKDAFVKNGMLTLPHGTSYRVLVLPKVATMRPELLTKIKQLVADGAVVLGPPPTHSPSLQNQPQADASVKKMASELWTGIDSKNTSAKFGKGMVFNNASLKEVFSKIGVTEDCKIPSDAPIKFGHRKLDGTDIYFITNQSEEIQAANLTFRVKGMQPELWNAIDGTMRKLKEFSVDDNGTTVPVQLQKYESAFIVFRQPGQPVAGTVNFPKLTESSVVKSVWNVSFNGMLTNPKPIQMRTLYDLSKSDDSAIKYFSGNIVYTSSIHNLDLNKTRGSDIYLDLGEVDYMAKVWINDKYIGGVWTAPYRLNITQALKQGTNSIRIEVANTWVNRMIGDKIVPEKERETWSGMNPYTPESPLPKSGLSGPVMLQYLPKQ